MCYGFGLSKCGACLNSTLSFQLRDAKKTTDRRQRDCGIEDDVVSVYKNAKISLQDPDTGLWNFEVCYMFVLVFVLVFINTTITMIRLQSSDIVCCVESHIVCLNIHSQGYGKFCDMCKETTYSAAEFEIHDDTPVHKNKVSVRTRLESTLKTDALRGKSIRYRHYAARTTQTGRVRVIYLNTCNL